MREKWLIIGAFAAIYIIWGSTYLANALAIKEIPPFFMAGIRFVVAGLLLYGFMAIQGKEQPTLKQWRNGTLMGILFLSIGNGALVKALQYVDSGLAALIIAFDPLIIVLMMWLLVGVRPGKRNIFGTFLGIVGMIILVGQPNFISSKENQYRGEENAKTNKSCGCSPCRPAGKFFERVRSSSARVLCSLS